MDNVNAARDPGSREHLKALGTLSAARTFFISLALLALAVHVGAWVAVQFGNVLGTPTVPAASAPVDTAAVTPAAGLHAATADPDLRTAWISTAMTFAEFLGRCAVLLLCVTMLLAVLVNVSGRMGGVAEFIGGFYVAIIVGALFIPWDRLTPHEASLPGVFTTMDQIEQHASVLNGDSLSAAVPHWAGAIGVKNHDREVLLTLDGLRFAGLPFVAMLLLFATGRRFTRGYRVAMRTGSQEIPMKVV